MAKIKQIGTVGFEILRSKKSGLKRLNVVITHRPPNKEVERVEKYTDYASYSSVYRGAKRAAKKLGYKFVGNICNELKNLPKKKKAFVKGFLKT